MRLVQFATKQGERRVGIASDDSKGALRVVSGTDTVYRLAQAAISNERSIAEMAERRASDELVDYDTIVSVGRLLPPLDHPKDAAHCLVSGTGLTHLRETTAAADGGDGDGDSDYVRLFRLGVERGKTDDGGIGAQPEWFYKGDGSCVVAPEQTLHLPDYALRGSEAAEVVGLYLNGDDGTPYRVGFALGNDFSDHELEDENALYLGHSKLRQCSFGPELLLGELPQRLVGNSRLLRDGKVIWEKPFQSGEAYMTHTVAGLERHHFKYPQFRRPGDVHAHFFGASRVSYDDDVSTRSGDLFEISAREFGRPLRNRLRAQPPDDFSVRML